LSKAEFVALLEAVKDWSEGEVPDHHES